MKYLFFCSMILTFASGYAQEFSNPEPLFDPAPYGFSHVATVPAESKFVFVAGQGGKYTHTCTATGAGEYAY